VTHNAGWQRETRRLGRPAACTRHFQLFKTVLLVAGLIAGRPGDEMPLPAAILK
jgi:hypothetical protein